MDVTSLGKLLFLNSLYRKLNRLLSISGVNLYVRAVDGRLRAPAVLETDISLAHVSQRIEI